MDSIREILVKSQVSHCVAFVIGESAIGHEAALARWLEAGFELGNHTHRHERASRQSVEEFRRSLETCDRLLDTVGAFSDKQQKWFRFPYLDRGASTDHRRSLHAVCSELGYRVAHASIDFHDHEYERPFLRALAESDPSSERRCQQRFLNGVESAIKRLSADQEQPEAVAYCHFGPIGVASLGAIVRIARAHQVVLCTLQEGLAGDRFAAFDRDFEQNGLVAKAESGLRERAARTLRRASQRLGLFGQRRLGPIR
jgi:peptidoglycan/xylan/chitin deacetylase (PgdA/CDA1 family)